MFLGLSPLSGLHVLRVITASYVVRVHTHRWHAVLLLVFVAPVLVMVLCYLLYAQFSVELKNGHYGSYQTHDETMGLLSKDSSPTDLQPQRVGPRGTDSPHDFDTTMTTTSLIMPSKNSAFNSL